MAKQPKPASKPLWRENLGELSFQGQVLRRFARPAPNQERLLLAFQKSGWQTKVPNPFLTEAGHYNVKILRTTYKNLNRKLRLIRFGLDEKGKFATWRWRRSTPKYTRK